MFRLWEGEEDMAKFFEEEISILMDEEPFGEELHLCEAGFEECRPTKPYEFIPIDYWVIHYCIDGEGYFQIRDRQNHIHPGDLFMIPPHTKNKYFPAVENPWSYRWIGLKGSLVESLLSRCGLSAEDYLLHHKLDSQLDGLFEQVHYCMQGGHKLKALGTALQLLDYLEHNIRNRKKDSLTPGESYFHTAVHFIHKNYFNNISISDIADAANIDRTYIFKLFQRYLNISPSQYLQQYRLDKACILLRKSSLSITDVSYAVGFQHSPYFTKLFTHYKGMTPSEYRKGFLLRPDQDTSF